MMGAPPQSARLRVGLLGAGYIAKWHADALKRVRNADFAGVYDQSRSAADGIARAYGVQAFSSLEEMLGAADVVHIVTPAPSHAQLARTVIGAGKHVFVEKPLALTGDEARALGALAHERRVQLGVNHNFLMLPGYERMRAHKERGVIGPVDSFAAHWRFSFPPLRSGPYNSWMLRAPQNLLFEIGPHLFAFVADFAGRGEIDSVALRYPIELPGGATHYQGWRISGRAGETVLALDFSFIEGADDRSIEARGLGAVANFNFSADAYRLRRSPSLDVVLGPLAAQMSDAAQSLETGARNAWRQLSSLNALAPFGLSITRACQSFYRSIAVGEPVDRRLSAELAADAIAMIEAAAAKASPKLERPRPVVIAAQQTAPTMLVIGGAGFIGRSLVDALAERGMGVRVFSRGKPLGMERADGRVEIFTGDLKSESDLLAAMRGIDGVFHLARADEKSWQGYLDNDVAVTRLIGECCLKAGVRRLVYAGTIDSYDASSANVTVTELTPFDANIEERNLYARSKAACEEALRTLADSKGLPLVIVRPGIVIGKGGPLQHWGLAMWRGATSCKIWGRGDNILPLVLIDDCAEGLALAMLAPVAEGRSFNLIGEPMLTARDYFREIGLANGVTMEARPTALWRFYAVDLLKYGAKRWLMRKKDAKRPSYRDWRSRGQFARFDNRAAKEALGWRPEADRARFLAKAIREANLFGISSSAARDAGTHKRVEASAPGERMRSQS